MAPPAANTTAHAGSAEKLKRCVVSLDQTKYLVTPVTLHRLLEMTFNRAFDLNTISERHHRLIYYAERELDRAEIEAWIDTLDAEREARIAAEREARNAARRQARAVAQSTGATAATATPAVTAARET